MCDFMSRHLAAIAHSVCLPDQDVHGVSKELYKGIFTMTGIKFYRIDLIL